MACVYALSHAAALLTLDLRGDTVAADTGNVALLLWLILVVQGSDFLQYVVGRLIGRHPLAPAVSPKKTWEGLLGGLLGATAVGWALSALTPYSGSVAAGVALAAAVMGFLGGLAMSAIKRDAGVKDFGGLLAGHGGMLDRVDSLCFAAPVVFHITRFFYAQT
jgi:phosphatidate cytidylyltransferase